MTMRYFFRCGPGAVGLTLLGIGLLITIIAVQNVRLRRMSDRVDALRRSNTVLLCRIPPGRRTYAYVGGRHVFFNKTAEFLDRQGRILVENDGTELRVELDGVMIACQTLRIDSESGQWARDEPDFYERIGVDFDFGAAEDPGGSRRQSGR